MTREQVNRAKKLPNYWGFLRFIGPTWWIPPRYSDNTISHCWRCASCGNSFMPGERHWRPTKMTPTGRTPK